MANIYYAKFNLGSQVYSYYKGETNISDVLNDVFEQINDMTEFKHIITGYKNTIVFTKEEIYSFSDLKKKSEFGKKSIYGKINRRYPLATEGFDETKRTAKPLVIHNNSVSISFLFDIDSEIITFCTRQKFGEKQFLIGFEGIINVLMKSNDFNVFLIKDPFSIEENLKFAHKVFKIKSIVVPPNANEDELATLYNSDLEEMERANIHKKTNIFESSKKNNGINLDSKVIRESLGINNYYKNYSSGYGKLEFDAVTKDGVEYHYDSDENSPFITQIRDEVKNSEEIFIEESYVGIRRIVTKEIIEKYESK